MRRSYNPARTRAVLGVFFWTLLGSALLLFAWLWFAGPSDIAADRVFKSARPCGEGNPGSCLTEVTGTLVSRRTIKIQRSPATYEVTVRPGDGSRPTFTGPVHSTAGNFDGLHAGEAITLRYYKGQLTNVLAPEGDFRTEANPTEQAYQDESLVQTIEWTLPIPLLPVGAYLYLTRRRKPDPL